ncbi:MAG: hypothetical protein M3Y84_01430 [Acidobacteriota bacterium]|nr:hypothetical protein [Acidobacteriota bacterium]
MFTKAEVKTDIQADTPELARIERMTSEHPISEKTREQLRKVRKVLLRLHKTLLDFERVAYEREHSKITNSYEFLNLAMHNPWFAWLRHLSELIVEMDEFVDAHEPGSESTAAALIEQSRILLTPTESGNEFQRRYFASLQQSPEVVVAHSEFARLLGPARLSKQVH